MSDDEQRRYESMPQAGARKWVRRLLPVLIFGVGLFATVSMIKMKRPPKRKPRIDRGVLVEVITARAEKRTVQVTANGVVQPRRQVTIAPEVNGRVRWISPSLVVGGSLKKGAPLLAIDSVDYKLGVERARAQVAQAERTLAEAESRARVARQEWKVLGERSGKRSPTPLTLHEPQLKAARAGLAAARADLQQAKVNLSRTIIRAPFNLRVRTKMVDIGQYVRLGQSIATVYGTDLAEIIVSLPATELRWLKIPGLTTKTVAQSEQPRGPQVTVRLRTGGGTVQPERPGVLSRTVGEVGPTGRMSKVVVTIVDPYNLQPGNEKRDADAPLLDFELGAFVDVILPGKSLANIFPLPAEALRLGGVVWVADPEDKLRIKRVTVVRRDRDEVLVSSGLRGGERVVLSRIDGAVDGLQLRVRERGADERVSMKRREVSPASPATRTREETRRR